MALDIEGVAFRFVCACSERHVTTLAVRGDQWPNPLPQTEQYPAALLPDLQYRTEGVVCALNFCTQPFEVRVQMLDLVLHFKLNALHNSLTLNSRPP